MENAQKVWQASLGELELQMTRATFNTWLKPAQVVSWDGETLVLGVPNGYIKDWLENRLFAPIHRTVSGILSRPVEIQFIVWPDEQGLDANDNLPLLNTEPASRFSTPDTPQRANTNGNGSHHNGNGNGRIPLNPKYTFDSFVVGSNNRLAHAASLAVANSPATAYNPLFLYGGVGLGKTHLLHAIGQGCVSQDLTVLYVSSEQFTNDLINAIRTQETEEFRNNYRNPDVLLIDDIQFIAGKESTQEEFFHTFNTLHAADKQIVLTSDRPPKAIPTLEERLRSRFEWGLLADIQSPDLETRIAILQFKVKRQNLDVPQDVVNRIAQQVVSNIRELEGALNRLIAYSRLMKREPNLDMLDTVLRDLVATPKTLTPNYVLGIVSQFYNASTQAICGRKRSKDVVRPRQVAMYLMRKETAASLPEIGRCLGGRDHTTVIYGVAKIEGLIDQDHTLRREIIAIQDQLYAKTM